MKQAICILAVVLGWVPLLEAAPNPDGAVPDAEAVQARIWQNMMLQDLTLRGHMRAGGKLEMLTVRTKGKTIVFEFDQGLHIQVEMTPTGSNLSRRTGAKAAWTPLTEAQRQETILGSDISFEDLGVDFLRWPRVRPLGTDSIKTLSAWAYEAEPPVASRYAKAHYWISSDFLAVLRVDAFNDKDQVVRRVEINGVQKFEDIYVIKEMMFATVNPSNGIARSRTVINLRDVQRGSGL